MREGTLRLACEGGTPHRAPWLVSRLHAGSAAVSKGSRPAKVIRSGRVKASGNVAHRSHSYDTIKNGAAVKFAVYCRLWRVTSGAAINRVIAIQRGCGKCGGCNYGVLCRSAGGCSKSSGVANG